MSDIINLNKARKAKLKQHKAAKAAENRVIFGLSTHERKRQRIIHRRSESAEEGRRLTTVSVTKTIDEQQ